jgi:hypothetical protein
MNHTTTSIAIAAAAMLALTSLSACNPAPQTDRAETASAQFEQARQQYARAFERLAHESKPITDRGALARKLKLSADRFGAIKTGNPTVAPNPAAYDEGANCKMGVCTCVGDKECNEMFSGICRNPSTGGYCEGSGDSTICSCYTEPPTPTERE